MYVGDCHKDFQREALSWYSVKHFDNLESKRAKVLPLENLAAASIEFNFPANQQTLKSQNSLSHIINTVFCM